MILMNSRCEVSGSDTNYNKSLTVQHTHVTTQMFLSGAHVSIYRKQSHMHYNNIIKSVHIFLSQIELVWLLDCGASAKVSLNRSIVNTS